MKKLYNGDIIKCKLFSEKWFRITKISDVLIMCKKVIFLDVNTMFY